MNITFGVFMGTIGAGLFFNLLVHTFSLKDEPEEEVDDACRALLEPFGKDAALRYEFAFKENQITCEQLPKLQYEHLRELGLTVGHAMRFLEAAAAAPAGVKVEYAVEAQPRVVSSA